MTDPGLDPAPAPEVRGDGTGADGGPPVWRWAFVGAIAGYLVGVVLAVPVAALVWGEATTTQEHRVDLWAVAFWGGVLGAAVGAAVGALRARSTASDATDAGGSPAG